MLKLIQLIQRMFKNRENNQAERKRRSNCEFCLKLLCKEKQILRVLSKEMIEFCGHVSVLSRIRILV